MTQTSQLKIKDYLIAQNLVTEEKLAELVSPGQNMEETLVKKKKFFSHQEFTNIKSQVFNLPVADLSDLDVESSVLNILSQKAAQNYQVLIFERQGNQIKVGMVDPGNFQAKEAIEFLAAQQGLKPEYYVISFQDFVKVFRSYSGFQEEIGTALESAKVKFEQKVEKLKTVSDADLQSVVKSAPVAKIVSVIIQHAVEGRASDIHIEPSRNAGRVRYRVDGVLHTSLEVPGYLYSSIVSRIKVLASMKLDETRIPQDGRIRVSVDEREIDLRVSVLPTLDLEKVVMRVLDTSAGVPTLKELGFSDQQIEVIDRNMKKPYGLFLMTGPTGSGKTTTLYSILNNLNSETFNITTLEDPIEYYVQGVNQSQINHTVGYTFASGLRAILRQDPNIIMVGEIRDNETAELAIHAGLTGHLVFSTLHTNSAWGAVPRLIDMKCEPFLLASTLNLVMAQRLVRTICPDCKVEDRVSDKIRQRLDNELAAMPPEILAKFNGQHTFYKGKGCQSCANSGYLGRTVVAEILEINRDLKDLIAEGSTSKKLDEIQKEQKFLTLVQDGVLKALEGKTTVEEVVRVSQL